MALRILVELNDDQAAALERLIADTDPRCPREVALVLVLQDWLAEAGYLSKDELAEGTPGQKSQ